MIGSMISAGMKVAGGIFGGIKASKAMKKQKEILGQREASNQSWYDRRYNEDATQRSSAQQAINQMRQVMQERTQRSAGTAAVMGGTEESVAVEKEAQNKALAGVIGNIAVEGDARKDNIEQQYMQNQVALDNAKMDLEAKKAENINNAIQGVSGAASGIAGAF